MNAKTKVRRSSSFKHFFAFVPRIKDENWLVNSFKGWEFKAGEPSSGRKRVSSGSTTSSPEMLTSCEASWCVCAFEPLTFDLHLLSPAPGVLTWISSSLPHPAASPSLNRAIPAHSTKVRTKSVPDDDTAATTNLHIQKWTVIMKTNVFCKMSRELLSPLTFTKTNVWQDKVNCFNHFEFFQIGFRLFLQSGIQSHGCLKFWKYFCWTIRVKTPRLGLMRVLSYELWPCLYVNDVGVVLGQHWFESTLSQRRTKISDVPQPQTETAVLSQMQFPCHVRLLPRPSPSWHGGEEPAAILPDHFLLSVFMFRRRRLQRSGKHLFVYLLQQSLGSQYQQLSGGGGGGWTILYGFHKWPTQNVRSQQTAQRSRRDKMFMRVFPMVMLRKHLTLVLS